LKSIGENLDWTEKVGTTVGIYRKIILSGLRFW